jgi:enamine deaminase RidA (YjgF/YER057c/UK114 family)
MRIGFLKIVTPGFLCLPILLSCQPGDRSTAADPALYDYDVEERIAALGIELNEPGSPVANYVSAVRSGNLLFMAGKGPRKNDGTYVTGKVGDDLTVEEGYQAARLTAIEQVSALKAEIGDLNRVVRIVRVFGMVNASPGFTQHPQVVNGFSDLMVDIFGERGKHARAAVGMSSLPLGFACEVEMVVEIKD